MIIVIHASGKSFKGIVRYLGHDPKADTKERVAWTHTLNTASDNPDLAMHEIYWTYKAADALKREAGIRKGGRRLEAPVKHFSLSWDPDDEPGKEHMIATVESFLRHMRWSEHQAILFAHNDTPHPHVHVVLNGVHPETGRKLDERNDWRRAERWGLGYELERGDVRCQQRLLHPEERTPTPTRTTWEQLRDYEREDRAYEAGRVSGHWDYFDRKSPEDRRVQEWHALKEYQRSEREAFFAGGKQAYREVSNIAYQEVRAAFRAEWKEYFAATHDGLEKTRLEAMKADIIARQKAVLDAERGEAVKVLRAERDTQYAHILRDQKEQRRELREAQEQGRNYTLLDIVHPAARQDWREAPQRAPRSPAHNRETWDALRSYERPPAPTNKPRTYMDQPTAQDRVRQERQVLKGQQRAERNAYYGRAKESFRAVRKQARQDVANEMRPTWQAIRQAKASGHDRTQLAGLKFIRLRQHKVSAKWRAHVAALMLKDRRDADKKDMALHHKAERNVLRHRQLGGLRSYRVMDRDRALISASEAVKQAQAREEARQQAWRQSQPQPPASMMNLESEAARFAAALRSTTERTLKVADVEERVRRAWRRIRPGPSRGRD